VFLWSMHFDAEHGRAVFCRGCSVLDAAYRSGNVGMLQFRLMSYSYGERVLSRACECAPEGAGKRPMRVHQSTRESVKSVDAPGFFSDENVAGDRRRTLEGKASATRVSSCGSDARRPWGRLLPFLPTWRNLALAGAAEPPLRRHFAFCL
jgi:hypothetical protein